MSKDTFQRDLLEGKKIENIVLSDIKTKYPKAHIINGYCKEWDIFIPELDFGVEVKSDKKSVQTGNIVIEIRFNNKPSALLTTKARYWVIYDGENFNWFTVENIKNCIIENNLNYRTFIGKGDTKEKDAYLIPKNILYKYIHHN